MKKIVSILGMTFGSCLGWWLGAKFGLTTGYIISTVGAAFGFYYGAKFARNYMP